VLDHPLGGVSTNLGIDPVSGQLGPMLTHNVDILHWGFAVEFSTLYLTGRFPGGPPKHEPLNQLVPLVEFAIDSSRGTKSIATMNPGLSYVAITWQIAVEAIVPLNSASGRNIEERNCCSSSMIWRLPCSGSRCSVIEAPRPFSPKNPGQQRSDDDHRGAVPGRA
jgi:hypothetical protein